MGGIEGVWDYPSPPEAPITYSWCDRCDNWEQCPCGCGWGWCRDIQEITRPDGTQECDGFCGEPPEEDFDNRIDMMLEERI